MESAETALPGSTEVEGRPTLALLGKENNHHHQKLHKTPKHLELWGGGKPASEGWSKAEGERQNGAASQRASRCVRKQMPVLQAGALRPPKEPPSREMWTPIHWLPQASPGRDESGCKPFKSVSRVHTALGSRGQ